VVRLRAVAIATTLLTIGPAVTAGRLGKEAIEVGPDVVPPKILWDSSNLRDIPSAIEGTVRARILIDTTGAVRKIKILESTDSRLTNRAHDLVPI
jgi:hypothetical protein